MHMHITHMCMQDKSEPCICRDRTIKTVYQIQREFPQLYHPYDNDMTDGSIEKVMTAECIRVCVYLCVCAFVCV